MLFSAIDWGQVFEQPIVSVVAAGLVVGPTALAITMLWAQKKREIGDLKEQTRFGQFDKHNLRKLFDDTVKKLGLPRGRVPVYITADKSLNAMAVRLGILGFVRSLNGIYLNRQLLHRLEPEEVQDIMGHELGHYYRHYLVSMRLEGLNLVVGGMLGLFVTQWMGFTDGFSIIAAMVVGSVFGKVSSLLWAQYGPTIEYLCDDLGAQVHGVHWSISGLLKLGVDSETQVQIYREAILSRKAGQLSPREVVESIERATPYGDVSREELEKRVQAAMKEQASKPNELSVMGFLDYMWNSEKNQDIDEQLEEQAKTYAALEALPRLDWESTLSDPGVVHYDEYSLHRLIEKIEAEPEKALFRLPQEVGVVADVHPPLKDRILYLWHNRREIDAAARMAGQSI
ncbi:MAG: hypothetical protein Aurels2KO_17450 [Aureliella sp.]